MTDNHDDTEPTKDAGESGAAEPEQPKPRRGSMRYQDESTTPREPTLAEQRAMRRAEQEEAERQVAVVDAERKSLGRRRVMIGTGVVVGLAATVAVWYAAAPKGEVTASCVDDSSTLSGDENICTEDYVNSHGGYYSGGFFFLPYPGGVRQYHYYYGGSPNPVTHQMAGGSTVAPSGRTTVKTPSGTTVQRGGFGVKSGTSAGTGGGKSGSSGGGSGGKSGGS
ncbi:hypothetical protein [Actinocrispum wychmicini]|uniref:Uncharacterized protein n=1 Tax=Actinocrispum wychmicini TaxID=1213861 RepID=A0A4R2JXA1_9PSEU|nr:hypothetical protein [Actinocrispum wychmicini]TCO64494.1 hypothetical protein EV192_101270 [Actinocrispum wychmicini]